MLICETISSHHCVSAFEPDRTCLPRPHLTKMETQVAALTRRELLRQRERLSRSRRMTKLGAMHRQVRLLEQSALALVISPNDDRSWAAILDPEVLRSWTTLRQTYRITAEIERLKTEHRILQRIFTERELARRSVEDIVAKVSAHDEWQRKVNRWRRLAQRHYRPLLMDDFNRHVRASLREVEEFSVGKSPHATDTNVLGWSDHRRVVDATHTLRFSSTKTVYSVDQHKVKDVLWALYADPKVYAQVILGGRRDSSQEVQQQIAPYAQVMRCTEIYDQELALSVQYMALYFRVDTDDGFIQFFRTIPAEEAMAWETEDKESTWPTIFYWIRVETLGRSDVRVSVEGRIHSENPVFAQYWCVEELGVMLRSEEIITGRLLLSF